MTLDQKILELVKKYMGKLAQKKVLTSMEEVEANTNETNLVGAPVVAELNNKLAGFEPICDAAGKITGYKTARGADTVFPFNNAKGTYQITIQYLASNSATSDKLTITIISTIQIHDDGTITHISTTPSSLNTVLYGGHQTAKITFAGFSIKKVS